MFVRKRFFFTIAFGLVHVLSIVCSIGSEYGIFFIVLIHKKSEYEELFQSSHSKAIAKSLRDKKATEPASQQFILRFNRKNVKCACIKEERNILAAGSFNAADTMYIV